MQEIQTASIRLLDELLEGPIEEPVPGPSSRFTRQKKRLLDQGIAPPTAKREELDLVISPDPLDISLTEPSQRPKGAIQSQLQDEDEQLRHDDQFLHTDSVKK